MKTTLQQVIDQAVAASVTQTVTRTADSLAETWAREILNDPVVRAEFTRLVREAFEATWRAMRAEMPKELE